MMMMNVGWVVGTCGIGKREQQGGTYGTMGLCMGVSYGKMGRWEYGMMKPGSDVGGWLKRPKEEEREDQAGRGLGVTPDTTDGRLTSYDLFQASMPPSFTFIASMPNIIAQHESH